MWALVPLLDTTENNLRTGELFVQNRSKYIIQKVASEVGSLFLLNTAGPFTLNQMYFNL